MAAVAASGDIPLRVDGLRNLLAASATFQTAMGVVTAAAALPFITVGTDPNGLSTHKGALVDFMGGLVQSPISTRGSAVQSSQFAVLLELPNAKTDAKDAEYTFGNVESAIRADMMAAHGSATYPYVQSIEVPEGYRRSDPHAEAGVDYFQVHWIVEIGI